MKMPSHRPSDVNLFLFRWPFASRKNEKGRKWESGEETGRAVGTVALLLGSEGDTEIELESSPEDVICGRKDRERCPLTQGQISHTAWSNACSQGDTRSTRRGVPSGRQGEPNSGDQADRLVVSWSSPGCL